MVLGLKIITSKRFNTLIGYKRDLQRETCRRKALALRLESEQKSKQKKINQLIDLGVEYEKAWVNEKRHKNKFYTRLLKIRKLLKDSKTEKDMKIVDIADGGARNVKRK